MQVIYFDIKSKLPIGNAQPVPTLDALLKESHVLSFMCLKMKDRPTDRCERDRQDALRRHAGECIAR